MTQTASTPTEVAVVFPTKRPGVEVVVLCQSPAGQRPFLKLDLISAKPMAPNRSNINEGRTSRDSLQLAYAINVHVGSHE